LRETVSQPYCDPAPVALYQHGATICWDFPRWERPMAYDGVLALGLRRSA